MTVLAQCFDSAVELLQCCYVVASVWLQWCYSVVTVCYSGVTVLNLTVPVCCYQSGRHQARMDTAAHAQVVACAVAHALNMCFLQVVECLKQDCEQAHQQRTEAEGALNRMHQVAAHNGLY